MPDDQIHSAKMAALSEALNICAAPLTGKVVYLDYPVHANVGDLLIWKGAEAFLKRHRKHITGRFSINNIGNRALRLLDVCDTICFHGGGNLGDLWLHHQKLREDIIARYPHKRIVILPQSVHFGSVAAAEKATAVFRAHPDLHIFCRDRQSLEIMQKMKLPNVQLSPDMAHALWGLFVFRQPTQTQPLYLLRTDKENIALPPGIPPPRAVVVDWDILLTGWLKSFVAFAVRLNERDGWRADNRLPAYTVWSAASGLLINRAVRLFAPYETIVTDRLHAVILSALMGRRVAAYDNSYRKVSTYIDCWLKDIPGISSKLM